MDELKDHPHIRLNFVTGFPHSAKSAKEGRRQIEQIREWTKDAPNPVDIDTVIYYLAWMQGDKQLVKDILKAEGEACREFGFTWKSIQKICAHAHYGVNTAYGKDYFKSVYESTTAALEAGADCAKTCTGLAAEPPLHDFVAQDVGFITHSLPMLMAVRDFNIKHGTNRWPKFSGGNLSEADVAVNYYASEKLLGRDVAEKMVMGAGFGLRKRELEFILLEEGPKGNEAIIQALQPWDLDITNLPPHLDGLPPVSGGDKPRRVKKAPALRP
jgi:hypothetical protein